MNTKTISMCQGKGSLSHNNRDFSAKILTAHELLTTLFLSVRIWAKLMISFSVKR